MLDETGQVIHVVEHVRDISREKQGEENVMAKVFESLSGAKSYSIGLGLQIGAGEHHVGTRHVSMARRLNRW